MVEIVDKNVLRSCQCRIIWYQLPGFKTIIVCSVHSIRFVKYVSFAKICFMKTSTRIVKYESRVVKSNPAQTDCISNTCPMREKWWYLEFFWSVFSLIRTEYRPEKLLNTDTFYSDQVIHKSEWSTTSSTNLENTTLLKRDLCFFNKLCSHLGNAAIVEIKL